MSEAECIARKWGNSIGIILPTELIKEENIHVKDKLVVEVKKIHKVKDFFGLLPNWKTDTQKIKDDLRKGWKI